MKENNIKYLSFSACLLFVSLILNYNTIFKNTLYIYNHFDFIGIAKIIQTIMALIILAISIICLIQSIRVKENGVNFLFNKFIGVVFIIYAILSICTYIYIRNSEEEIAMKMKNDIENYGTKIKQEQFQEKRVKNKNLIEFNFYNTLSDVISQNEYSINDKYYERKKEIIEQVENSSRLERYMSMLFYNFSYDYYGSSSTRMDEIRYYGIFLKLFCIGLIGAMFYLFNLNAKDDINIFYNKNNT